MSYLEGESRALIAARPTGLTLAVQLLGNITKGLFDHREADWNLDDIVVSV